MYCDPLGVTERNRVVYFKRLISLQQYLSILPVISTQRWYFIINLQDTRNDGIRHCHLQKRPLAAPNTLHHVQYFTHSISFRLFAIVKFHGKDRFLCNKRPKKFCEYNILENVPLVIKLMHMKY